MNKIKKSPATITLTRSLRAAAMHLRIVQAMLFGCKPVRKELLKSKLVMLPSPPPKVWSYVTASGN
jgi:hypothetical protein